jgi:hypothetical protein
MTNFESKSKRPLSFLAFALTALVVGCGGGDDAAPPAATVTPPVDAVGGACAGADCVSLGTAGNYAIFALAGVTNVATSAITGNVALNSSGGGMTGFSETAHASGTYSTSAQVTGKLYHTDHTAPTPAELTTAMNDTGAAFVSADAKVAPGGNVNLGAGNLTGMNLAPGVYSWNTGVSVDGAGAVTLTGSATDVWVFQIAGDITMNPGSTVTLAGGALSKNVFWRTTGVAALNTTAHLAGIVLSGSSVTLANGATVNGRLYASTAVTLIANTVTRPAP